MGILRKLLLAPQLRKDLISEGQLAQEMGWAVNAKGLWKRVLNDEGEVLMEGMMLDESNLYMVDPAYFVDNLEALQVELASAIDRSTVPFAGMADVVKEAEEEKYERLSYESWYRMRNKPVRADTDPIREVRRLA